MLFFFNFIFSFFLVVSDFTSSCLAAPTPAMGSSLFAQNFKSTILSTKGFKIGDKFNYWTIENRPSSTEAGPLRFLGKNSNQLPSDEVTFSVATDTIKEKIKIENYVKQWSKEYHYFGFETLSTHTISLSGEPGFIVDLIHRASGKQIRQFVARKGSLAVIMTCKAPSSKFKETIEQCHNLVRSLEFTSSSSSF
jgi:hypothetical protein